MMNIHPKFSQGDLAGAVGLLAFLADPEACKARLIELTEAAEIAYKAQSDAQVRINEERELQKTGAEQMEVVNAAKAELAQEAERLDGLELDLAARSAAHDAREKAIEQDEKSLAVRQAALDAGEADLAARRAEHDKAAATLAQTQAEYEGKLQALRALAG